MRVFIKIDIRHSLIIQRKISRGYLISLNNEQKIQCLYNQGFLECGHFPFLWKSTQPIDLEFRR